MIPAQSWPSLFWRFLRFGLLAWGGPVAQIAMVKRELVDEERWVDVAHFNRVLGLYQVLPGPEAHELCVYFGMLARGRLGGIVAGLGFMLPGFLLMLALSWAYVTFGLELPKVQAVLLAVQAAVAALIVRAIHRIGSHALRDRFGVSIALAAFVAQLGGVVFALSLLVAGLAQVAFAERQRLLGTVALMLLVSFAAALWQPEAAALAPVLQERVTTRASLPQLAWSGLRAGLLTFGGAYTAIPILQKDAVITGGWMTNAEFLDGIALGGILPAPLIIFSTFVGYLGGGLPGALVVTGCVFLPAFAISLIAHEPLERLLTRPRVRVFLDGVVAGVVGVIAATTVGLVRAAVTDVWTAAVFAVALLGFFVSKSRWTIPAVLVAAGMVGALRPG